MNHKNLFALTAAAGLMLGSVASAKIGISLDIELLREGGPSSTPLTNSGLLVLVSAGVNGTFEQPENLSYTGTGSDDAVLTTWDLNLVGPGTSDITLLASGVEYGTAVAGQKVGLFWYPNLSDGETPGAAEEYGFFTDAANLTSGDGWILPADGTMLHSMKLFTADASTLVTFGELPSGIGSTNYAVGTSPTASSAPTAITTSKSGGTITVAWTGGSAGAGGWVIQRKVRGSSTWSTVDFANSGTAEYADVSVRAGLEYEYRVIGLEGYSSAASSGSEPETIGRSIFTGIAARGYVDNSALYTLLNGGIILKGTDPKKLVIASGIGPHNATKFTQPGQWAEDPYLTHNLLGQAVDADNQDWILDSMDASMPNPDLDAIKATFAAKANVTELSDDPDVAFDAVILEELPIDADNIFKVRTVGADKGFVAIEVYDAEYESGPGISDNRIYSISSRSWFPEGVAGAVSNASVTIEGDLPKEVLAIAQGPSILPSNPTSTQILHDPILRLQKPGQGLVTQNDDWNSQTAFSDLDKGVVRVETDINRIRAALVANNHDPDDFTKDSVLLVTLMPGDYIFRVVPKDGTQQSGSVLIALSEYEAE